MNTKMKIISMIAVVAAVFTAVSPVFADDGTGPDHAPRDGQILENLGLTPEEFKAMRESGMTMKEICEAQGVECIPHGNGKLLETLGLTAEEFKSLRGSGMTIEDICEQQGVECPQR